MRLPVLLLYLSPTWVAADSVGKFFSPPQMPDGEVLFSSDLVYTTGVTLSVEWTTTYSEYTIAIWQQSPTLDAATLGPIVYEADPPARTKFFWTVQAYGFDLTESNIFFLWLHPGGPSEQGDKRNATFATHYFNITETSTSSTSSASSTSVTPMYTSKSTSEPTTTSAMDATAKDTAKETLSSGAQAGIGVSAGFAGLFAITCAVMLWRKRRTAIIGKTSEPQDSQVYDQAGFSPKPEGPGHETAWQDQNPVEMEGDSHHQRVELG